LQTHIYSLRSQTTNLFPPKPYHRPIDTIIAKDPTSKWRRQNLFDVTNWHPFTYLLTVANFKP